MKQRKTYTLEQLQNKILYYINYRIRSKKEVLKKLQLLQASDEHTTILIEELERLGLIDDEKFIVFFIRDYIEVKKYGLTRVKQELFVKGFESWLVQDSLRDYCENEEYLPIDDAYQLIKQKYNTPSLPDDQKILAFLARRGFEYSLAKQALSKLKNDHKDY